MIDVNIYKNGYVYNNVYDEYLHSVSREILLPSFMELGMDFLINYFKGMTIIPVFRFFLLNDDESIKTEISEYISNASVNINKQVGQVRTINLSIANYNNFWAYGARKPLWDGAKIRYDAGFVADDTIYWSQQGIYLVKEPNFTGGVNAKNIQLTLCDKWGLWDSSVYGNTHLKTIIPNQVPINQVFNTIVHETDGVNENRIWDTKEVLFDMNCANYDTFYTIKQDAGQNKAQLLTDTGKTISADIYYDRTGHMRVKSNILDFKNSNFAPIWRFTQGDRDCDFPNLKYNKSNYCNKITTKGAIVNGYQFTATIENRNKRSLYNVYDSPATPKVINNTKLFSDQLCMEQCMYEMVQQSRGLMSVTMNCSYLPFLDFDKMVYVDFPDIGIENTQFVIDGISYNTHKDCKMSLKLTSNNEVVF